jgi:LysM repeat protein
MLLRPLPVLLVLLSLTTGCVQTRQTQADIEARQRALEQQQRRQEIDEYRRSIQMQVEDTDTQLAEVQAEMRALRAELNQRPQTSDLERLQNRIAGVENLVRELEVRRQKDREELLNILSKRMADILNQQQAAARSSGRTHTVIAGETLSAIAAAYRVKSTDIIQLNNISNPNALRVGQKLVIPAN